MIWNSSTNSSPQSDRAAFLREIAEVKLELMSSLSGLYPPLLNLVRSRILAVQPMLRAGFVLTTAFPSEDNSNVRGERLLLAAALEMLYVALSIHKLLVQSDTTHQETNQEDTIDKSVMGSTILAGDFCFSRASMLAARTNSPDVVQVFSQGLQRISENQLRQFFDADNNLSDEATELFVTGALASTYLVDLTIVQQEAYAKIASQLSAQVFCRTFNFPLASLNLSAFQMLRWNSFSQWLHSEFSVSEDTSN